MTTPSRRLFLGASISGLASFPLFGQEPKKAPELPKELPNPKAVREDAAFQPTTLFLTWHQDPTTTMDVQWVGVTGETLDNSVYYTSEKIVQPVGPVTKRSATQKINWQVQKTASRPYPKSDFKVFRTELTGLTPGTDYSFRIGKSSPIYKFRTMPSKANDTIHFISGGDCGVNSAAIANNIQAARQDPMFAIVGGDLGYDNGRSVDVSLAFLRNYSRTMVGRDGKMIPMIMCIGNHEVDGSYGKSREKATFFYPLFEGLYPDTGYTTLDFGDYLVFVEKVKNLAEFVVFPRISPRRWASKNDRRTKKRGLRTHFDNIFEGFAMRIAFEAQSTLDCPRPDQIVLNLQCRDEIVPILRALQFIYSDPYWRKTILDLVGKDVNRNTSKKRGRTGLSYWEITVLAAVRLGCNCDYDKLQNLAEEHRTLRLMMGIGAWEECQDDKNKRKKFDWSKIRDNVCLLRPETLKVINQAVVAAGHSLVPEAIKAVRGDSFVVETDIHYPTESSLIGDGLRKVLQLSAALAREHGVHGWRQHQHLDKTVREHLRAIRDASRSKKANKDERVQKGYRALLCTATDLLSRATLLLTTVGLATARAMDLLLSMAKQQEIQHYVALTRKVCDTARRRVLEGETVSNADKIFSIFEPHTELIKRDKQPNPNQFGHNVLVIEDAVGFVCHYAVMANGVQDVDIMVSAMKELQERSGGKIERASFDRGFHSPDNQKELAKIVEHPCLAAKGAYQGREQHEQASVEFRESRRRHPGVESAIGALQAGNGMERCRDRSQRGYERYVGLGILGRNLHVLGKLLIAQEDSKCQAAKSKRKAVA